MEAINADEAKAADRGAGTALWRTRLILPAENLALAKKALLNIRFRERVNLDDKSDQGLGALLHLAPKPAKKRKARLRKAGVFLVAKPTIIPGILLISQHEDLFIIDLVRPYGPPKGRAAWTPKAGTLAAAASRRPDAFTGRPALSAALQDERIGIVIAPERIAEMLLASELDGLPKGASARKKPDCAPFVELAAHGHFEALSLQARVDSKSIAVDLQWHLRSTSNLPALLTTRNRPLLAADGQALHAVLRLDQIGRLRKQKRSAAAQTWDALWAQADRCHAQASGFAWAIDWPHIAGLFLDEVGALHPQSLAVVDSLGALALSTHGEGPDQQLIAEAWVREPGALIASGWLRTLFGHEKRNKKSVSWSRGPMRPYAIAHTGGAVIGVSLVGKSQVAPELTSIQTASRGSLGNSLLRLRANPSILREDLLRQPLPALLAAWHRLSADLTIDKELLRFTIDLQRD